MDRDKTILAVGGLIIVCVIALLLLGKFMSRERDYGAGGLDFAFPDQQDERRALSARKPEPLPVQQSPALTKGIGSFKYMQGSAAPARTRRPSGSASSGRRTSTKTKASMKRAEKLYYKLVNHRRFKESKSIKRFRKEYLNDPHLRRINERYQRDADAVRFMVDSVKSPNFLKLVAKHVNEPDISAFVKTMMRSPNVIKVSQRVSKEHGLEDRVDDFVKVGLPNMANAMLPEGMSMPKMPARKK